MSYHINLGQWNTVFAVPSSVTDQHLKLASSAQLKVLLYLLRHAGEPVSDESISKATGCSADEVANAAAFWVERGLLACDNAVLSPPAAFSDTTVQQSVPVATTEPVKEQRTAVSRAVRPDSVFVARLLHEDKNLAGLLEEAQRVLKKPLSPGDTATLVMLYDTFGLPCEVLALLMYYAESVGSANMRAVERIGIGWSDAGVYTVEGAEREIERMTHSREAWGKVSSLLGLRNAGRPTQKQLESADRWLNEWGFNDEMILEAYERCVNTKGEYNMSYINGILKRWYEKRIFSLDTLRESEEASSGSKKAKKKPSAKGSVFSSDGASFDLDQYEKQSLFDD